MSDWKPPADAVPVSEWKPPSDAVATSPKSTAPPSTTIPEGTAAEPTITQGRLDSSQAAANGATQPPTPSDGPTGGSLVAPLLQPRPSAPVPSQEDLVIERQSLQDTIDEQRANPSAPAKIPLDKALVMAKELDDILSVQMPDKKQGAIKALQSGEASFKPMNFSEDPAATNQNIDRQLSRSQAGQNTYANTVGWEKAGLQFSPQEEAHMRETGAWTERMQQVKDLHRDEHQFDVLNGMMSMVEDGVKSGKIDPQQGQQMYADLSKRYDYNKEIYRKTLSQDTRGTGEKLAEQEQKMVDVASSYLKGFGPQGIALNEVLEAQKGLTTGVLGGASTFVAKPLAQLYRGLVESEGEHGVGSQILDFLDQVNPVLEAARSTKSKDLLSKEGFLPSILNAAGNMAPLVALSSVGGAAAEAIAEGGASAGQTAAIASSTYLQTYHDTWKRNIDAGVPSGVAKVAANIDGGLTAALFSMNPNLKFDPAFKGLEAEATKQLLGGVPAKEAYARAMKVAEDSGSQVFLMALNRVKSNVINAGVNRVAGTHLPEEQTGKEIVTNTIVDAIMGGVMGLHKEVEVAPLERGALLWAGRNPDAARHAIEISTASPEQKQVALNNLQKVTRIYRGNDVGAMDPESGYYFMQLEAKAQAIKDDIKENPTSEAALEVDGGKRELQLQDIRKEQRDLMGLKHPEDIQEEEAKRKEKQKAQKEKTGKKPPVVNEPISPFINPVEETTKPQTNAAENRIKSEGDFVEHQDGNESGKTASPEYRNSPIESGQEQQGQEVIPTNPVGDNVPPVVAEGNAVDAGAVTPPEADQVKKTTITKRAYEGTFREEVKGELEKTGLYRDVESHEKAKQDAKDFIAKVGEDAAVDAVVAHDVHSGPAAYILEEALQSTDKQVFATSDPDQMAELAARSAKIIGITEDLALQGGRFNSARGDILKDSDSGWKLSVKSAEWEKEFGKKLPEELANTLKELEGLKKKLFEAEQRAKDAEESATVAAIKDSVMREKRKNSGNVYTVKAKAVADQFRRLKSKPLTFTDADGNTIDVTQAGLDWNKLVELGAKAIEKTGELADGIAAIAKKLEEAAWFASLDDRNKKAILKQLEDHFKGEQQDNGVEMVGGRLRIPKQMIREAVEAGANDIGELTAAIKEQIKEKFPDATDREVRDGITEYGKVLNMSRDEISAEIRRMRRIGRDISALEDVQNKKRPLRSGLQRDKLDAEERALKAKLREAIKDLPVDEEANANQQAAALDIAKTRVRNSMDELNRRLKEGDFSKKPTKPVVADTELTRLNAQKVRLREQYDKEYYKQKILNRTPSEKRRDAFWQAWGLGRVLQAGLDFSFIGIQGGKLTISNLWHNPAATGRAFKNMWSAMGSEHRSAEWLHRIKAQEWYPQAKKAGLALTEPHGQVKAREELFMSDWAQLLWRGLGTPLKWAGKPDAYEKWSNSNPYRAVERGGVGYLDTLRVERWLDGIDLLEKRKADGKEVADQDYKDLADMVNTFTGRASIGAGEKNAETLAKIFYSPRLWAAQIKTSTPYAFYHFGTMRPTARMMALQDMGRYVGTTMGVVSAAAIYYANDDDPDTGVETDPRSSEFGKIKVRKGVYIDPWGGMSQQIVLTSRLVMGAYSFAKQEFGGDPVDAYKSGSGKVSPLGIPHRSPSMAEVAARMATNKLGPMPSLATNIMTANSDKHGNLTTAFGQPYSLKDDVLERLYPMYGGTVYDLSKHDPKALDGFLMFMAVFGNVQTYHDEKNKSSPITLEDVQAIGDRK